MGDMVCRLRWSAKSGDSIQNPETLHVKQCTKILTSVEQCTLWVFFTPVDLSLSPHPYIRKGGLSSAGREEADLGRSLGELDRLGGAADFGLDGMIRVLSGRLGLDLFTNVLSSTFLGFNITSEKRMLGVTEQCINLRYLENVLLKHNFFVFIFYFSTAQTENTIYMYQEFPSDNSHSSKVLGLVSNLIS